MMKDEHKLTYEKKTKEFIDYLFYIVISSSISYFIRESPQLKLFLYSFTL